MEEKAKQIVKDWYNSTYSIDLDNDTIFTVWSCYILGNRKYMVGTKSDYNYFEVTYNKNTKEWYLNVYTRKDRITIKE